VDGGPPESWPTLRALIERLPAGERHVDLAVVSHIDSDHIGGMVPLLADRALGVTFGDVWFNGLAQLPDPATGRMRSVAEGESLAALLSGAGDGRAPPWNAAFAGAAVMTPGDRAFVEVPIDDGPRITLLSPTPKRLTALRRVWVEALERLKRGESEEAGPPAPPEPLDDLPGLAATATSNDQSVPNGSSIAFLLEHEGASCLLAADAFPTVLGAALWSLVNARGGKPLELDVFKLPHHGSRGNVTAKLVELAPARHYVVSTSGEHFNHPHDVALARVVTSGVPDATLWFNYDTPQLRRWDDPALCGRYGFATRFPGGPGEGARLAFP
jgi:hypothetical protein